MAPDEESSDINRRGNAEPTKAQENVLKEPLAVEVLGKDVQVEDEEQVYIAMRRIKTIQSLNPEKCKSLNINACILDDMSGVSELVNLEELELSENNLTKIEGLTKLTKIRRLDLSFNKLKSGDGLDSLVPCLEILRLQNNRIPKIPPSIGRMENLVELELGSNKIKKFENVPSRNLRELWLGRNRLRDDGLIFENLEFPNLKILSLQNNALTKFPTELILSAQNLEEIYLSENFITQPPEDERILNLKNLQNLDLSYNKLTEIGSVIPKMTNLRELWLNNNQISNPEEIKKLKNLTNLQSLYLEANPLKDNLGPGYRQYILSILPNLQQVDAVYLGKVVIKESSKTTI